jgi:hypothetical protein
MARKKSAPDNGFAYFDVFYEDGTRSSHRKIPSETLGGLDGDEPARALIEAQDQRISDLSGKPRRLIKRLARSA